MTDRKISLGQGMTVLFLALFPLGTECIPGALWQVGTAAWLCPLLAGAVVVGVAALLSRTPVLGQGDLGERIARQWGRRTGRVLAGLFFLWGLYVTTAHAVRIGGRLSDSLRASPVLLTAVVLVLAGWFASGGVPAFARACEIFVLAVGFGFGLIVLFGAFRLEGTQVLLWDWGELAQVPRGALSTIGMLAVGGYLLFLLGDIRPEQRSRRRVLLRLGTLFVLLAVALVLVLGRLGAPLAAEIDAPFFQMVSGLGFEGAFQRLEGLVSALWILGDVVLVGLLLLCLGRLLGQATERGEEKRWGWLAAGLAFLGSWNVAYWNKVLAGPILPLGNLAALVVLVVCLGLTGRKTKKSKKFEKRD